MSREQLEITLAYAGGNPYSTESVQKAGVHQVSPTVLLALLPQLKALQFQAVHGVPNSTQACCTSAGSHGTSEQKGSRF